MKISSSDSALLLPDWGVLVTRPTDQAVSLCCLLEQHGAKPIRFPTLAIQAPENPVAAKNIIARLDDYDMAVFISANAVEWAFRLIGEHIPPALKLVVIGKASARALRKLGFEPDITPLHTFNSEALLELPRMNDVSGQRIVIFRGQEGRGLLREVLQKRGAQVDYAEVYQRIRPLQDPAPLIESWKRGKIHAVTVTSNESLQNLFDMLGSEGQRWLCHTPLVVVSERARDLAHELGFQQPVEVSVEASDQAIIDALLKLKQRLT